MLLTYWRVSVGELHVFVDNNPLQPIAVTSTSTPSTASFTKIVDSGGVNVASVDPSGRLTVNSVAQSAISLYTEATTSRTTSGNSTSFFWSGNVTQVFCGINVTALSGGTSPTITISLQQQDANGVYQVLSTTPALNQTGIASFSVGTGMTNGQMISSGQGQYRFSWVIAGTPTTCSFQIGLTGR